MLLDVKALVRILTNARRDQVAGALRELGLLESIEKELMNEYFKISDFLIDKFADFPGASWLGNAIKDFLWSFANLSPGDEFILETIFEEYARREGIDLSIGNRQPELIDEELDKLRSEVEKYKLKYVTLRDNIFRYIPLEAINHSLGKSDSYINNAIGVSNVPQAALGSLGYAKRFLAEVKTAFTDFYNNTDFT